MLGGYTAEDCAEKVRTLLRELDLNITLEDLGVTEGDIPWLTQNCFKVPKANIDNNPTMLAEEDVAEIYRRALHGESLKLARTA